MYLILALVALAALSKAFLPSQAASDLSLTNHAHRNDSELQISFTRHLQMSNRTVNETKTVPGFLQIRERKRQERIRFIQSQILTRLGVNQRPNATAKQPPPSRPDRQLFPQVYSTIRKKGSKVAMAGDGPRDIVFGKLRSFYPSCNIPSQSDESRWSQQLESEMKLYFDLNTTQQGDSRSEILVILAKMRLYRKDSPNQPAAYGSGVNQTISIVIYQYLKPLKAGRKDRRRQLDSRTIPAEYHGWVEFDVSQTATYWKQHPEKNFGLSLELMDCLGVRKNPLDYLEGINCDGPEKLVVPSEAPTNSDHRYPTLDLMTIKSRPRPERAT